MLKKLKFKFKCAFRGLHLVLVEDHSIRLQLLLALASVVLFTVLKADWIEWLFILSAVFLVIIAEFINSTFERFCDLITSRYNLNVRDVKDLGAGFVLVACIYALLVAGIIMLRRVL